MKTKLLVGLVVLLGAAAVAFLLMRSPKGNPAGEEAGPGGSAGRSGAEPGGPSGDPALPKLVRPGSAGGGSGQVVKSSEPDAGQEGKVDSGEPHSPPHAARLEAEALVRQRDMVKTELEGLRERVPKLKAVLDRVRSSGAANPKALEQIQTQLQQTVDSVTRLERELPDLEARVAKLPKPAPGPGAQEKAPPAP